MVCFVSKGDEATHKCPRADSLKGFPVFEGGRVPPREVTDGCPGSEYPTSVLEQILGCLGNFDRGATCAQSQPPEQPIHLPSHSIGSDRLLYHVYWYQLTPVPVVIGIALVSIKSVLESAA